MCYFETGEVPVRGLSRTGSGVSVMSQCTAGTRSPDFSESKHQLHQLLGDALALIDSMNLPAEVGARLQEVIDLLEEHRVRKSH